MGMSELSETIEETELFCDYCGKVMGFIKWFTDISTPSTKEESEKMVNSHRILCSHCRITNT